MGPWLVALVSLVLPLAVAPAPQTAAPDAREQQKLVAEYLELGTRAIGAQRARQLEIVARLGAATADARAADRFAKSVLAAVEKRPGLPKGTGRQYLWEKEKRGLFIVGGKTRGAKALFVGLHGGGVGVGDADDSRGAYDSAATALGWLAIYPQVLEKTEHGWTDSGTEEFVLELIERAIRTHGIPPDRVFLSGHSMGGYGTWTIGARHADRFAGLASSAGAPTPLIDRGGKVTGIDWGVIPNLRNTRLVSFQSSDDEQVPPAANRAAAKAIEEARAEYGGFPFEYWEVDRNGHDFPPKGVKALLDKIANARREARPTRVVWQPVLTWKRQFHWLHWEQPKAGTIVDARLDRAKNTIEITTSAPATGLAVLLDGDLVDLAREVVVRVNDDERYRGIPRIDLGVVLDTAQHGDADLVFTARVPLDG